MEVSKYKDNCDAASVVCCLGLGVWIGLVAVMGFFCD